MSALLWDSSAAEAVQNSAFSKADRPLASISSQLLNTMVSGSQGDILVMARSSNDRGPSDKEWQVVLYRRNPDGFQTLRRWLSDSEINTGKWISQSENLSFFYDIFSAYRGHIYNVHVTGDNLREFYGSSTNYLAFDDFDVWPPRGTNMFLIKLAVENRLLYTLTTFGIPAVTKIVEDLGDSQMQVHTTFTSNAVVHITHALQRAETSYELEVDHTVRMRSHFSRVAEQAQEQRYIGSLVSTKLSSDGKTWATNLVATYYRSDPNLASLDETHYQLLRRFTLSHDFRDRQITTNNITYKIKPAGVRVPVQNRSPDGYWFIVVAAVSLLGIIVYQLKKAKTKHK